MQLEQVKDVFTSVPKQGEAKVIRPRVPIMRYTRDRGELNEVKFTK